MFIKVDYNNQKRKFKLGDKASFAELSKELLRCFGEEIKNLEVGYFDEENELIRVTNQEEWEICVEEFTLRASEKNTVSIDLKLNVKDEEFSTINQESFIDAPIEPVQTESSCDWRIVDKDISEVQPVQQNNHPEPSIFESQMEEETPAKVEQPIPRFVKQSNGDLVMDVQIEGTEEDLKKIEHTIIHKFAPMAGFCIDSSRIETKRPTTMAESSILNASQTSTLTNQMRDEIEELIEKKFKLLQSSNNEHQPKSATYDHYGVTCDNCSKRIVGIRYKSLVKPDFDLCETCEATGVHPEPLIKIRAPLGFGVGMKLNAHFETIKNLISNNPTKVCPYAQKKAEEKKVEAPKQGLCHVRKSMNIQPDVEPQAVSKPQCPALGLCHIRRAEPQPTATMDSEPNTPTQEENKMTQILSRMLPGVDRSKIIKTVQMNKGKDIHDIANIIIDSFSA